MAFSFRRDSDTRPSQKSSQTAPCFFRSIRTPTLRPFSSVTNWIPLMISFSFNSTKIFHLNFPCFESLTISNFRLHPPAPATVESHDTSSRHTQTGRRATRHWSKLPPSPPSARVRTPANFSRPWRWKLATKESLFRSEEHTSELQSP